MTRRFAARHDGARIDLTRRADTLASRLDLPDAVVDPLGEQPAAALGLVHHRHQADPHLRPAGRLARLGPRLRDRRTSSPTWSYADHGPAFHALVDRYPRAERARGYLIAKSGGDREADDESAVAGASASGPDRLATRLRLRPSSVAGGASLRYSARMAPPAVAGLAARPSSALMPHTTRSRITNDAGMLSCAR